MYETADGYIALAMGSLAGLGELLGLSDLQEWAQGRAPFEHRDVIKARLAAHLRTRTTKEWLAVLEPAGYWCSDVLTWDQLMATEAFQSLQMIQTVAQARGSFRTTRCPIRLDGQRLMCAQGAPSLGEHTASIDREFSLA
jgi:crotonobetainyl-CoA:carnitine CoA-transferase CaiB-like acyl-CoA transferase